MCINNKTIISITIVVDYTRNLFFNKRCFLKFFFSDIEDYIRSYSSSEYLSLSVRGIVGVGAYIFTIIGAEIPIFVTR